ncbi:hypothetical protein [Streptomyces rapamycinicus]|uniref:Uncharacterized protein n=2 Tax=Streptomyces rapamycinicus TaxID=1226757 RepID=A0A0A0NJ65_STRRN|nr:hypothetical protein [Streptomyces rapamycinicus]AGP54400.1 hypothetical protein M271_14050 [Streptomyces rapamycinicus NRRL 5491]MBB4781904.1 1,6-anhydro-N-acetylmuramate kinase [Streptomyces rapamycinicus]RLV73454.1 hypothetical protein D3C57_129550 [Streptomyces rapamycinicus NRRL 5491]UTO62458.1 hypothetical protein LJB45_09155 [Streptomyces rapamycinicus]UTP30414.1 hypothetical protein LIV37_14270 [Streptomyces rapamycinicus NRRL 5491]
MRSDGSLTVASLAAEAGVSRASAYRCPEVVDKFRNLVAEREYAAALPASLRQEVQSLKAAERELRQEHAREVRELRSSINVLAQQVQFLTVENQRLSQAPSHHDRVTRIDRR